MAKRELYNRIQRTHEMSVSAPIAGQGVGRGRDLLLRFALLSGFALWLQTAEVKAKMEESKAQPEGITPSGQAAYSEWRGSVCSLFEFGSESTITMTHAYCAAPCEFHKTSPAAPSILMKAIEQLRVQSAARRLSVDPSSSVERTVLSPSRQGAPQRNWIRRHPVLFGTLVGFAGGFVIGAAGGDDGVFDDFVWEFNGVLVGGIGAGMGALVGLIVSQ